MVYLITYDLNKVGQDYNELYNAIKKTGTWWHYLDSTWLVQTALSSNQIFESIKHAIDNNDSVLIVKITTDHSGWLPQEAWNWINKASY